MRNILTKTIFYHIYLYLAIRIRRRRRLQSGGITELDGINLSIGRCSPFMKNVILDGWYERPERRLCQKHLRANDQVVELGSAIGFLSLFCRVKIGISRFAMVEANPATIEILRENYALNHLEPLLLPYAVGSESGTSELDIGGEFWANSITGRTSSAGAGTSITVPTLTLREILSRFDFHPNVLIIDIEGSETAIDPASIPLHVEAVLIEIHPAIIGVQQAQHLLAQYDQCDFRAVDVIDGTYFLVRGRRLTQAASTTSAAQPAR